MNILAFDTSTEYLSLALLKGDETFRYDCNAGQTHSQIILPQIQTLLDSAYLQLSDLQGIAFGAGPGSFTGVRIAAGVAQGLGFGANLPVVSVCTLLALAEASGSDKVIACLDARMGEVYHAAYEKTNDAWQCIIEPGLYKPDAVPAIEGINWVGAGSGWQTYAEQLSTAYAAQLQSTQPQLLPGATAILQLALSKFAKGEAKPASEAMPLYIRNRVALKTAEREQGLRL
ncbi:MAG: tRNA (adenosine(37)-N6)-threonylcarbamoyltransferase complex dimerization subunit type 1 TsaB [Methylotenera sp.]|uniref:tRNA (adenosine(37)-N6)-threonylcarbamoyltransferase complex dimerization subunit type 1 TsaB n=1 Tax=Methylotenera sp. TaxID=2051956 RepID=UPI00248746B5|nr:tRNA (adenosine(37)-N6)-threonylcarbamoyltransferase complex dimerization subunit type 1 TsaB [Methylotenera sp.]MDI1309711.1 tRNA (adenosine(37)-N6)-threonylcarbamoyltransferase complex dimerization subunit type 1 TsaB [Methylotenera sp.]